MNTASASTVETVHGSTRHTILRAARELIQTRSYLGFSFQDLADRVGIRKASLYHHFPSKEALGVAVLEHAIHTYDKWFQAFEGTPEEGFRIYINGFRNVIGAGQRVCPAAAFIPGWDAVDSDIHQTIVRLRQTQVDWLTAQLTRQGRVTDPADVAGQIFALCQGALISARVTGRVEDFDAALAPMRAQLGLTAPPSPTGS
ncbi:MAG TPA: TetR/AcrR family transcriptional regulator [Candidatus Aquabacterium excrementipullorum]|nr:TetR/AcrR family transcriptional regulator [Candidatus Aquabacterium excrementipullorum]